MIQRTFARDWPVRLNDRQDTTYLAGQTYTLSDDLHEAAEAAGVLEAVAAPKKAAGKGKAGHEPD